jgi:MULE transposase domain
MQSAVLISSIFRANLDQIEESRFRSENFSRGSEETRFPLPKPPIPLRAMALEDPYGDPEPSAPNTSEIQALRDENARLRAQLQEIREAQRLRQERDELMMEIEQLGVIPNSQSIEPSRSTNTLASEPYIPIPTAPQPPQPPQPEILRAAPLPLPLADPVWKEFSFDNYDLPPLGTYTSRKEALSAMNQWGLAKGYGFSNAPSKKKKSGFQKAIFACDRRYPKAEEADIKERGEGKNKSSRGCNCPFSVKCQESKEGWILEYREPYQDPVTKAFTNFCVHNHRPASGTGLEIPAQRREQRKGERYEALVKQLNAGSKPRQILTYLDENFTEDMAIARDIYNVISHIRTQRKGGKSAIETLLLELEQKGWICRPVYDQDDSDRLLSVFFAHSRLLEYARLYGKVLIIDHTYNTNSGEMPLFECIGIDATGKSFCVCFEFTAGEDRDDCIQSLELLKEMLGPDMEPGVFLVDKAEAMRGAIEKVFPDWVYLLCVWHANKNVSANCKAHFEDEEWKDFLKDWTQIVYAPNIEAYEEAVAVFKTHWQDSHIADVSYIERNWLVPRNRDRIVSAWANQHLHLGNNVTSRAEGIHGTIKEDIHSKNIDLLYAWDIIDDVVLRQLKAMDYEQRRQREATKPHYQFKIFDLVRGHVSFRALDLASNQLKMAKNQSDEELGECTERFTQSIGIPCKHLIKKRLDTGEPLRLIEFSSAYHLRAFEGENYHEPTLPPVRRQGRVYRHNGSQTSTRRVESAFERAARETAQKVAFEKGKAPWKCSVCRPEVAWGHKKNMVVCPRHPKHHEWLASQGNTANGSQSMRTIAPIRSNQQQFSLQTGTQETEDIIEVDTTSAAIPTAQLTRSSHHSSMPRGSPNSNTTDSPQNELAETHTTETQENATILISDSEGSGDPDYDPDLNLDQYAATTFTTESGFRHHQIGRDINDLPQEKQRQVMKLFKALPAPEIEEDEDGGGPVSERTEYRTRGQSAFEKFEVLRKEAERNWGTIEAIYFMYKYKRNLWRSKQKEGSSLSDQAYRKACDLPVYTATQLKDWKKALCIRSLGMLRFCETRQEPHNIWTLEEKVAWADWDQAQTDWTEQEEALIAERWGGRAPGVGDYERARGRRDRGLKLTEHELKLLEDSIDTARERWEEELQEGLRSAHITVDNMDPDDEFLELDRHQEDILQINATRETAEALEFWKGKVQNESRGKRMAPGPSPSKPSSTGKPLRSAKKVKRGGKK